MPRLRLAVTEVPERKVQFDRATLTFTVTIISLNLSDIVTIMAKTAHD